MDSEMKDTIALMSIGPSMTDEEVRFYISEIFRGYNKRKKEATLYTKDDLIRLLEKDHIKPIRYIFNMSDRIIVDRDIHINIEEVF